MKTETIDPKFEGVHPPVAKRWSELIGPVQRLPQRLKDPRFWRVQLLVLVATVPHYVIETVGFTEPFETLHGLAITLYIIPLLYAALNFGWEGAILTALWTAALTSPSTWLWHRSGFHWLSELGQLAVTLPVGLLVAWRVDRETDERLRAERTSASLRLLNEVGEILSHTLDVEHQLPQVVRRLQEALPLESCWIWLEPESGGTDGSVVAETSAAPSRLTAGLAGELHKRIGKGTSSLVDGRVATFPLLGDTGILGSLVATARRNEEFSDERLDLLSTVAHEVRVAVENARLSRQRQESLQSYVRQVTQAQEDERLRIARELHDETAQELVHLTRKLEELRGSADPGQTAAIESLLSKTRTIIQAVRRYSRDLRPSILDDLGLLAAIEMVIEDLGQRLHDGARLQVVGTPRRLDGTVELALFRIAQEALRNVEKHSNAASATVEMDFCDDEIRLSIADDGKGFELGTNTSDLLRRGKLGFVGMKERAELVGGVFQMESSPGAGTQITVTVKSQPLPG
jgi:signal transduction histidine kinase